MADLYSEMDDTFNDRDIGHSGQKWTKPFEVSRGIGDSPPPREEYMPKPMMNSHGAAIVQN